MRNAVIRKKLLKEQTMIRRFIMHPQRIVVNVPDPAPDWRDFSQQRFYNIY
ncbi:hypothetical protein ACFC25_04305 [Pseudarthrobacter sp. NPDC055928]|uniref:hypothetical protein n=1 Tax=Pseudarthrobacter sp. NPDC055928 TaxID=3345661 RepID=UPI0035D5CB5D